MLRLDPQEASVVRMYHLEGKSYEEISKVVGMSENSIGPVLTRARGRCVRDRGVARPWSAEPLTISFSPSVASTCTSMSEPLSAVNRVSEPTSSAGA